MRKLSICVRTMVTALAVSAMTPAMAFAAGGSFSIPGGKVMVIGGSGGAAGIDCAGLPGGLQGIDIQSCLEGSGLQGVDLSECFGSGSEDWKDILENITQGRPGNGSIGNTGGSTGTGNSGNTGSSTGSGSTGNGNSGNTGSGSTGNGGTGSAGTSQDAFAERVVELVNAERAKAGVAPLTVHSGAAAAAQVRVKELEKNFSHTRPNGSDFSTALTQAGVRYTAAGENIAYGQQTPEQVMQVWMNSSGHRANILNSNFTSIGVGHYVSPSGVHYWSQMFMR